jgi:hypothetical protein
VKALLLALALAGPAPAAPSRLSEGDVRGLVERQSRAWNAGDLAAYFATFSPAARFIDQALGNDNRIVPYGVSTLAQARAQSRRTLASAKVHETLAIEAVSIAADGRSARLSARAVSDITRASVPRRVCARRIETFEFTPAGPRATGQTDTIARCRPGAAG